jgi:PAS domain S-box-containing protein
LIKSAVHSPLWIALIGEVFLSIGGSPHSPPADFEAVFEAAPDPMLLVDDDRAFVAGNKRARELLRVTPEQLRAMRLDDITAGAGASARLDEQWASFQREGERAGTFLVLARDGTEHEVEFSSRANYEPGRHLSVLRPIARGARPSPGRGRLSGREREVLRLLASGATASDVARQLFLSRATVATHVRNAMVKLGAHTRIEAVVIAMRDGEIGY